MSRLTANEVTEILRNHPLTQDFIRSAEKRENIKKKRIEVSRRLGELREEKMKLLPQLRDDINTKKARFEEAQEEARKAQRVYSDAERFLMSETFRMDREIAEAEGFLRKTAPEDLKERIETLKEKKERVRTGQIDAWIEDLTGKGVRKTNAGEIVAEMGRIEGEIKELEGKLLEAEKEVN